NWEINGSSAVAKCDTGPGVRAWIKQVLNQDLVFQHIKVIYPTAPARPYTPMRGALSTVWFDRWKISNECPEHIETIDSMCQVLTNVIDDEVKNGISKNRIILGGFSMGGGMAMHLAYRYHQDVAGVFALSSFLNKTSAVYQVSKCQSFLQIPFGAQKQLKHSISWGVELINSRWSLTPGNVLRTPSVYPALKQNSMVHMDS
uniref:palmitoyl-protein hydrolase n=1 Tax=Chrysemys picta bellii TaxID=8478 RepID=A0A8C3P4Y9_CHRPI